MGDLIMSAFFKSMSAFFKAMKLFQCWRSPQSKPRRPSSHRLRHQLVVLVRQPLERLPAHPFRLVAVAVGDTGSPPQALSESVGLSHGPAAYVLP